MSKQEDFGPPEKPLEKTQKTDNEAGISKKADYPQKLLVFLFLISHLQNKECNNANNL